MHTSCCSEFWLLKPTLVARSAAAPPQPAKAPCRMKVHCSKCWLTSMFQGACLSLQLQQLQGADASYCMCTTESASAYRRIHGRWRTEEPLRVDSCTEQETQPPVAAVQPSSLIFLGLQVEPCIQNKVGHREALAYAVHAKKRQQQASSWVRCRKQVQVQQSQGTIAQVTWSMLRLTLRSGAPPAAARARKDSDVMLAKVPGGPPKPSSPPELMMAHLAALPVIGATARRIRKEKRNQEAGTRKSLQVQQAAGMSRWTDEQAAKQQETGAGRFSSPCGLLAPPTEVLAS